jgi:hypothetical protein
MNKGKQMKTSEYVPKCVPGTGRKIMGIHNGVELQRAHIYMPAATWDKLRELGKFHEVSDSKILEQLVEIASATHS